jgi:hypothetical protein
MARTLDEQIAQRLRDSQRSGVPEAVTLHQGADRCPLPLTRQANVQPLNVVAFDSNPRPLPPTGHTNVMHDSWVKTCEPPVWCTTHARFDEAQLRIDEELFAVVYWP